MHRITLLKQKEDKLSSDFEREEFRMKKVKTYEEEIPNKMKKWQDTLALQLAKVQSKKAL